MTKVLTFQKIIEASISRSQRWHKDAIEEWSMSDWAIAIAGEVGEMCNAVKKLRRIETNTLNINEESRQLSSREEAIEKIGQEMADVILYMPQLAHILGIDLPAMIIKTFNKKSEEYNFPERL